MEILIVLSEYYLSPSYARDTLSHCAQSIVVQSSHA